jgi:hypothetical protein
MPRKPDQPDIEARATVRAKKLRKPGETSRDYERTWHTKRFLRVTVGPCTTETSDGLSRTPRRTSGGEDSRPSQS